MKKVRQISKRLLSMLLVIVTLVCAIPETGLAAAADMVQQTMAETEVEKTVQDVEANSEQQENVTETDEYTAQETEIAKETEIDETTINQGISDVGVLINSVESENEGSCGDDVTWTFNAGILTISGTGAISSDAFKGITSIQSIVIEEGITEIGSGAFYENSNLKSLTLPENLKIIGQKAFYGCTALQSVVLPSGLTQLNGLAFGNCTSLKSVTIPSTLTTVEGEFVDFERRGPFYKSSMLAEVTLEEGLESIPERLLQDCTGLIHIEIPDSVKVIKEYAFWNCTGLEKVVLPNGLTQLNGLAFGNCTSLKSVTIPSTLTTVEGEFVDFERRGPFYKSSMLAEVTLEEGLESIPERLLQDCTGLIHIEIPDSVKVIKEYAFWNCTGLEKVVLPSGLTQLNGLAFGNCTSLKSVTIPSTLTTVEGEFVDFERRGPFYKSSMLAEVTLEEGLESIPERLFRDCTGISSMTLPSSITTIEKEAFLNCSSLKKIQISASVTSIAENAFYACNVKFLSTENSYAVLWAIENGVDFQIISDEPADYSEYVLDMESSGYYTSSSTVNVNSYVPLTLNYTVKDIEISNINNTTLMIVLAPSLDIIDGTVKLNGELLEDYDYKDNILTIPVTESSGKLQLSVRPLTAGTIATYAKFAYRKGSATCEDIINVVYLDVPVLTLIAPGSVSTEEFTVSGVAEAKTKILFYIDENEVGSILTKKDGTYAATLKLPEIKNNYTYVVKAVLAENSDVIAKASVKYKESQPVLKEFKMYYMAHESRVLDLMEVTSKQSIYFAPGHTFTFKIQFDNADSLESVKVISTKNGVRKTLIAEPTGTNGEYIATGYFDENNKNYTPGNITLVYETAVNNYDFSNYEDLSELSFVDPDSEIVSNSTVSEIVEKTEDDTQITEFDINLADENSAQFHITQTQTRSVYSIDALLTQGYQKVTDGAGNEYYIKWEMDYKSFEEMVYDVKKGIFNKIEVEPILDDKFGEDNILLDTIETFLNSAEAGYDLAEKEYKIEHSDLSPAEKQKEYEKLSKLKEYYAVKIVLDLIFTVGIIVADMQGLIVFGVELAVINVLLDEFLKDFYNQRLAGKTWKEIFLGWLIDPSGYAYEAVTSNRLSGVKVTAYFKENLESDAVKWDAWEYSQLNPLITDSAGCYAWDVPEGYWQVVMEKDGYTTWSSEWLSVPPAQTEVNGSMVSAAEPEVEWVNVYEDSVQIQFTKYMKPETVENIILKDGDGNQLSYVLEYSTEETNEDGIVYADFYELKLNDITLSNRSACCIVIPETVQSYAGISVTALTLKETCKTEVKLAVSAEAELDYGAQLIIPVTITPADEQIVLEASSDFEELAKVISIQKSDQEGIWNLIVEGRLPGTTSVTVSVLGSSLSAGIKITVLPNSEFEGFDKENSEAPEDQEKELININTLQISEIADQTYVGEACIPSVKIENLIEGKDFTVEYSNNTKPGTAKVTITGIGDYTGIKVILFSIKLAKPELTEIFNTSNGVQINWKKVTGASGYYVYLKNSDGSYTKLSTVKDGKLSYTYQKATSGKTYTYMVKAYYGTVTSAGSSGKSIKYLSQPMISVSNSSKGVVVSWKEITGASGYYVYSKASDGSYTKLSTVKDGKLSYTYQKVTSGKTYTYMVKAYYGTVTSAESSGKSIKYLSQPVVSVSNSSKGVVVSWKKITGASGYYVYSKASDGSYTKLSTVKDGKLSYTYQKVTSGKTYTYMVKAYYGTVTSAASSGKNIKYLSQPVISVSNSSKGIVVSWKKVTGAGGYYVYRKASGESSYKKVKTISKGSTVTWTDSKKTNGKKYSYKVQAYSGKNVSTVSSEKAYYYLSSSSISSLKNNASKKITVKWTKNIKTSGYQIQYSLKSSFKDAKTVTVKSSSSTNKTITKLIKGKKYYVRIRCYKTISGKNYYSSWSSIKSVKIGR